MRRNLLATAVLLGLALLQIGCSTARRGEALGMPVALGTPAEARGQQVFMQHCQQCHPGGAGGLGPALNDKPLPGFMIRLQVRNGLGAMPAFSERQIAPAELDDLIAYLKALRRAGRDA
ncbi:MAG: c-type cytochrome [Pseudomonadota bacterium]|uniref:c-type cytochrome n=1 Tax=Thermithiobacillus tepidarius TaxID=929 RepID=UPI0004183407|nr:cytochrome c [Thermithiobacillus tepidarius]